MELPEAWSDWRRRSQAVLAVGERLLESLAKPRSAQGITDLESLLEERQALLQQAGGPPAEAPPPQVRELADALLMQQQELEERLKAAMADIARTLMGSRAAQANVESFRRLVQGPRSRLLDQRR